MPKRIIRPAVHVHVCIKGYSKVRRVLFKVLLKNKTTKQSVILPNVAEQWLALGIRIRDTVVCKSTRDPTILPGFSWLS